MIGDAPQHPPCVILAGGLSRRMGHDKAGVMLAGRSLLQHVVERMRPQVSALALNAPAAIAPLVGLPLLPDTLAGYRGPLAGILTAMRYARSHHPHASHVLTVPIDSPILPVDLTERLAADLPASTIAVANSQGAMHPVCALWPVNLAEDLDAFLDSPREPRVKSFLAEHATRLVDFPPVSTPAGPVDPFLNVNTPEDLQAAEAIFQEIR